MEAALDDDVFEPPAPASPACPPPAPALAPLALTSEANCPATALLWSSSSRSEEEPDSGFSGGPCSTPRTPEGPTPASTPTSTPSPPPVAAVNGHPRPARRPTPPPPEERSPSMYVSTGPGGGSPASPASPRFRIGSLVRGVRGALQTMSLRRKRLPLQPRAHASLPPELDLVDAPPPRRPRVPPPPDPDPSVWGEDASWILQFDNVLKHPGGKHRGCRCDVHSPSPQRDPLARTGGKDAAVWSV